jgi:chitinase
MMSPKLRWAILSTALVAGVLRPGPARAAPDDKEPAKVFVGYVYGPPRNVNFRLYTHICHAFLVPDGEGRVQRRGNVPRKQAL